MDATARGLLGCTPGEVTDGQPFYGHVGTETSAMYFRKNAHLTKIHLLPLPVFDEPIQVVEDQGPSLITCAFTPER
jgi:hypothetical protein